MAMSPGFGLKLLQMIGAWAPVSVADIGNHARVIGNADLTNGVVQSLIDVAIDHVETQCNRKLVQQQWLMTMDEFPGRQVDDYRPPTWRYGIVRMPFPPLISVDLVQYVDPDIDGLSGQPFPLTTLSPTMYQVDTNTEPGRLCPAPYQVWPVTSPLAVQAVQVTFTCGYTSQAQVPPTLLHAIKLLTTHLYDHRAIGTEKALKLIPTGLAAMIASNDPHEYC